MSTCFGWGLYNDMEESYIAYVEQSRLRVSFGEFEFSSILYWNENEM